MLQLTVRNWYPLKEGYISITKDKLSTGNITYHIETIMISCNH